MSPRARLVLFAVVTPAFAVLFFLAARGLPSFGSDFHPYGDRAVAVATGQRATANVVSSVNFDQRAVDTLGEEFILFGSVLGTLVLLRPSPGERKIGRRAVGRVLPTTRLAGYLLLPVSVLVGLYVIAHGQQAVVLLVVTLPLLAATGLAAAGRVLPRLVIDATSMLTCLLALAGSVAMLLASGSRWVVSWLGGYSPEHGTSVGVVFVVDRIGAGLATLVTAALAYTWRYFDEVEAYFHALVLLFLAGMVGFALTGDLFNAFVFFELMGAVAYALTGYKIEEAKPLQGALNFAVINSLGAYCSLLGIGLIYGRTGELGFAQVQRALAGHHTDWLVLVAAALLFSGVMVELGSYGVARTWSAAFSPALPAERLRPVLMVAGVVTAVIGAVMCQFQSHLKRLLAFSTVGHVGMFLVALGAFEPAAVGGLAVYVLGHAAVKGATPPLPWTASAPCLRPPRRL